MGIFDLCKDFEFTRKELVEEIKRCFLFVEYLTG